MCEASGTTVGDLINDLEKRFPGLARYLVNENGSLRRHVDILIDERLVSDREKLLDNVRVARKVVFRQSLAPVGDLTNPAPQNAADDKV